MLDALKETLLQVFIAYLPALALQVYLMKPARIARAYVSVGVFSILSVFLCMLFSFYYLKEIAQPFDFRVIPYVIGILYGGYRLGGAIVLLYLLIQYGFNIAQYPMSFWADPLLYITPVLFLFMNRFCLANSHMRMYMVMNFSLVGMALYIFSYSVALWDQNIAFQSHVFLFMALFGLVLLITAIAVVFLVESVREKTHIQHGYTVVWRKYQQEAEKLRQVIDTTPLGVYAVDANARITNFNQQLLNILRAHGHEYEHEEVIGLDAAEFFSNLQLWEDNELYLFNALRGERVHNEVRVVDDRTYLVHGDAMRNQQTGEIVGAVGMMHDITELEHLRAEMGNMERLSLVGQMAASITHEIRNPMAVVRGFIQLMRQKNPGHMDDYYNIVMEELDRANGIINDFLSLAQNRIVEKEEIDLHHLLKQTEPLLWADANLRGQEVVLELDTYIPPLLLNPKEMKQMLFNLTRNAMEAMGEKGKLTISTQYVEEQSIVELRVTDTGLGIPDVILEKLFEPFYTTKQKGTGLGLPLCLSIIEGHGGSIRVESKPNQGTTFIVTFKAVK